MKSFWGATGIIGLLALGNFSAVSKELDSGKKWLDNTGQSINAHGGGVLIHQGVYYWYGEIKSGHTYLPDCNKSWGGTRVDLVGVC